MSARTTSAPSQPKLNVLPARVNHLETVEPTRKPDTAQGRWVFASRAFKNLDYRAWREKLGSLIGGIPLGKARS